MLFATPPFWEGLGLRWNQRLLPGGEGPELVVPTTIPTYCATEACDDSANALLAPGVTIDDLRRLTAAPLRLAPEVRETLCVTKPQTTRTTVRPFGPSEVVNRPLSHAM